MARLEAEQLVKHFSDRRGEKTVAVDGVSLALETGDALGLVGESGCGKSTLARMLMGILNPTSGSVTFNGEPIKRDRETEHGFRRSVGIVFQDPLSSLDPRMRVREIIGEPLEIHGVGTRAEREERVRELLDMVDLEPEMAGRYPHQFSGGQKQRIGLARALALEPEILLLDEPVSALDVSIQANLLRLIRELQEKLGVGFLFIAHDLAVVRMICRELIVLYRGRVAERGPVGEVFHDPRHPYTRKLVSAIPHPDPDQKIDTSGPVGEWDESLREGCVYSHRCPHSTGRCLEEVPEEREAGEGRLAACHHFEKIAEATTADS